MPANNVKEMRVYKLAFENAMHIYEVSKRFPKEERYALTGQIRRSSRSVCSNLAEAFRKRQYPAHFVAKISDSDMENTETETWLDFSLACKYNSKQEFIVMAGRAEEIGKLLNHMLNNPEKY
jgi:four helix bundle protein